MAKGALTTEGRIAKLEVKVDELQRQINAMLPRLLPEVPAVIPKGIGSIKTKAFQDAMATALGDARLEQYIKRCLSRPRNVSDVARAINVRKTSVITSATRLAFVGRAQLFVVESTTRNERGAFYVAPPEWQPADEAEQNRFQRAVDMRGVN